MQYLKAGTGLLLLTQAVANPATANDLKRAKTKKPRDIYKGDEQAAMSKTLNSHLKRSEIQTLPCEHWSTVELQNFMATISEHRSTDLQDVYRSTADRRDMRLNTVDDHKSEWETLNHVVSNHPHLYGPQQEAHCREAVMWWVHHLSEYKKNELRANNLTVPLLPEGAKKECGRGEGAEEAHVCSFINEKNSCDWCHSTQARHDAGEPGTSVPDALKKFSGPDDGNPHGWDRQRRCDQDGMPRCKLCEGIGGQAYGDANADITMTTCTVVAEAKDVDPKTVAPPIYPKQFTVKRKDGKDGGYSDTLIGWKTDPFCFGFFPQNDSVKPLCYRSETSSVKYYDIEKEAERSEYNIHNEGIFSIFPNITSVILQVQDTMWVQNDLWGIHQCICTNPSGNHCDTPPCKAYPQRYNTFETAQHLGREKIRAEWIQDHGVGAAGKEMELDHFILWTHHIWTDPVSKKIVRAWKPFNGLQLYDPEAWVESVADPSVWDSPPARCKKGGGLIRIKCSDDGHYNPGAEDEGLDILNKLAAVALAEGPAGLPALVAAETAAHAAKYASTLVV